VSTRALILRTVARRRRGKRTRGGLGNLTSPPPAALLAQIAAQHQAVADQHQDAKAATLDLRYEQLGHGRGVRVTSPDLPGWAAIAKSPADFAKTVDAGWRELAVAAYAARRNEAYDLAPHADVNPPGQPAGRRYPERYPPSAWTPLPGGAWRSPSGRTYRAESWQAKRIVAQREAAGLPVTVTDTSEAS
jgi:hypothetical protein